MLSITILMWNSTKWNPGQVWILSRYFPSYQKDILPEKRNDTVVFYVHKLEVFFCYPFPIYNTSQQRSTDTLFQKTVPSIVVVKCKINTISILSWEIIYIKQIFYWQNIVYTHTFPFYNYSYMYVLHVCQNQEKLKTIFYSSTSFWSPTLLTSMSRIST